MKTLAVEKAGGTSSSHINDLARAAQSDADAARALKTNPYYTQRVKKHCGWICKNPLCMSPEDLEQEFYIDFEDKVRTFRGESDFMTWTVKVLTRRYLDAYRTFSRRQTALKMLPKNDRSDDNPELGASFREVYLALTQQQKRMFELKADGKTQAQIALELGIKTQSGEPNVQLVCKTLREVRDSLYMAIEGWQ